MMIIKENSGTKKLPPQKQKKDKKTGAEKQTAAI
jgi:hypothetical protein